MITLDLVSVQWVLWGYTVGFGSDIGGLGPMSAPDWFERTGTDGGAAGDALRVGDPAD